jgi:hypothetical protein
MFNMEFPRQLSRNKYRVFLKESALIQEKVSWIKLHRYCQKYLHPMVNDYEENGKICFKE